MVNRSIQPGFTLPVSLQIPEPQELIVGNGKKVLWLNIGTQSIVRITLQFPAGSKYQKKLLQASSTLGLMPEGTKNFSAQQVAEKLDFLGSQIDYSIDRDHAVISVFCLNKYVDQTLEVLKDIVLYPKFDGQEFETFRNKRKSSLAIEKAKVMYQAREVATAAMFGKNHPYGAYAEVDDYSLLEVDDLKAFHQERFLACGGLLFVSGLVDEVLVAKVAEELLPVVRRSDVEVPLLSFDALPKPEQIYIEKDDAVQSAVRLNRTLFARNHPDYVGMHVLTTILGGYFGSRLMSNIREDKGYTYGIFSSVVPMQESGFLTIATEVGCNVTLPTIVEIKREMDRLRSEKVGVEELSLVVNYMVGEMLRMLDGPFSIVDVILDLYQSGLPVSFINEHFAKITSITSEELHLLAQKYLNPADFIEVVVGKR